MPQYQRPCSLAEIRQLLELVFDDAGLDAFCLDYFEDIYDKFGRGMQKTEKLTVLLNACRNSERFQILLQALHRQGHPHFQTFFAEKNIAFSPKQAGLPLADYDMVMPSNFDLDELVNGCLNQVIGESAGLFGFLIPCHSILLLNNLCERLKREWDRSRICIKPLLSMNSIHTPTDRAIRTLCRYILTLQEQDVVVPLQCAEKGDIDIFWQQLCQNLQEEKLTNRLVLVMSIHHVCTPPEGAIVLDQPRFQKAHVLRWVRQVIQNRKWPDQIVRIWTNHIVSTCSEADQLQIDWVYEHLQAMGDLLKQDPSLEKFQQELEKRREWYVQTSY